MKTQRLLEKYKNNNEVLNSIKNSVVNSFDTLYVKFIKDYSFFESNRVSEEYYDHDVLEIGINEVIDVMNSINEDISQLELLHKYSEEADEPYFAYRFSDLWEVIKRQEPWMFLVAIVELIQKKDQVSSRQNLELLMKVIQSQLKLHTIEYEELILKQIFVAMSFSPDMKKVREAIVDAIKTCGYKPMLIDIKEHNSFIVPEIFSEIEKSKFVIADLSHQRAGVYFEAGYGLGKGIPVILSCKKSEASQNHFDVAQINTIFWEDTSDLTNRLIKRIESIQ